MAAIALLFPGQGAQAVGMGRDLAAGFPAARDAFAQAGNETGLEMERLCFEGPVEELSRSDVTQPAILTVSVAALRALVELTGGLPKPVAAAGLSLGEYTALVAAGALEFGEAARIVHLRGQYMQEACEANPGTMYSILGLADEQVEQACERARERAGGVWPANYNCPGQLVISGEEEACQVAAELCAQAGARRALRLNVAGAFHTELMRPAAERMKDVLAGAAIAPAACPVVSNETARPVADPEEIRRLLVEQITRPVLWHASMRWLVAQGVGEFYEVGPGRVLQGLLKRIAPEVSCFTVGSAQEVQAATGRLTMGRKDR